ncbi:hypothetical protein BDV3_005512 [Batrachochytrium dendrobatidis]|uniref:Uncharacterized protein n=2 Tax=Batrachochytrium dendrobatidis (strain JEL423) TaxID=403673 RepID=A0A177WK83_BATDL|nr:hypothetical protein BDEG_23568 [Batrachochytrium dendrobatidis JEL423]
MSSAPSTTHSGTAAHNSKTAVVLPIVDNGDTSKSASKAAAKASKASKTAAQVGSAAFRQGVNNTFASMGLDLEKFESQDHSVGNTGNDAAGNADAETPSLLLSLNSQPPLSLDQHRNRILNETKNVSSFVVIGQTLHRLYYVDKLVKNQREFLEWTKRNLGFSKSTTYEYIISYKVYSEIASKLPPAYRPPAYQSHCQLLSKVPEEMLVDTWMSVCHAAPNGTITTAFLESFLESKNLKNVKSGRSDEEHIKRSHSLQSNASVDDLVASQPSTHANATEADEKHQTQSEPHKQSYSSDVYSHSQPLPNSLDLAHHTKPSSQSQLHAPRSLKKARSNAGAGSKSDAMIQSSLKTASSTYARTPSTPSSKRKRSLASSLNCLEERGADDTTAYIPAGGRTPLPVHKEESKHSLKDDAPYTPSEIPVLSNTPRGRRRFDETAAVAIAAAAATAAAAVANGRSASSIKTTDIHSMDLLSPRKRYSPPSAAELQTPNRKRTKAFKSTSQSSPVKSPLSFSSYSRQSHNNHHTSPTIRNNTSSPRKQRHQPSQTKNLDCSIPAASSVFQSPSGLSLHHLKLLRDDDLDNDMQSNMLSRNVYSPNHISALSNFIEENSKSQYPLYSNHNNTENGQLGHHDKDAFHDDYDSTIMGPLGDIIMTKLPISDSNLPFHQSTIYQLGKEIILGQHFDIIANSSEEFTLIRQQGWFGRVWCDLSSSQPFSTTGLGLHTPQNEYSGLERQLQIIFTKFDCKEFVEGLFLIRGQFGADWFTPILQTPFCILRHVTIPCSRQGRSQQSTQPQSPKAPKDKDTIVSSASKSPKGKDAVNHSTNVHAVPTKKTSKYDGLSANLPDNSASDPVHVNSFDSYVVFYLGPNVKDFCIKFSSVGLVPGINSWSAVMSTAQLLQPLGAPHAGLDPNTTVIADSLVDAVIHNATTEFLESSAVNPQLHHDSSDILQINHSTAGVGPNSEVEDSGSNGVAASVNRKATSQVSKRGANLRRRPADAQNGSVSEAASALCDIGRIVAK